MHINEFRHVRLVLMLVALSVLVGCGTTGFPGFRPRTYETPAETRLFYSTDAKRGCPHEAGKETGIIMTAIATSLIKQGLSNFGNALEKAAEGGELVPSVAMANLDLAPNYPPSCIVVIRGSFGEPVNGAAEHPLVGLVGEVNGSAAISARLKEMDVPVVGRLEYYLEMRGRLSVTQRVMTMAPIVFLLKRSIDGDEKGTRRIAISVGMQRFGADKIDSAVDLGSIEIGRKSTYFRYKNSQHYPYEMPWFATPFEVNLGAVGGTATTPVSPAAASPAPIAPAHADSNGVAGEAAASKSAEERADRSKTDSKPKPQASAVMRPGQAKELTATSPTVRPPLRRIGSPPAQQTAVAGNPPVAAGGVSEPDPKPTAANGVPVLLTTKLVEVRPTKEALAFFATLFKEVTPVLEERAIEAVDETARIKARFAALTASESLKSDAAKYHAEAIGKVAAYCEAKGGKRAELAEKAAAAVAAQLKANSAAAAAAQTGPYSKLVEVTGDDFTGRYNEQFCT